MSWYVTRRRRSQGRYPPSLRIEYPNWAKVRFLEEPRQVQVNGEDRWCVNVEYLDGTAYTNNGPAEKGKTYTLWIGKTLAIALSNAFADPDNPDKVPKLRNQIARIARGERKIRDARIYIAEKLNGPLLEAAPPKVERQDDVGKYVESFKDVFKILGEVTLEEMKRWFDNKFEQHPPVETIAKEMVKQGLADFDGKTVKAI